MSGMATVDSARGDLAAPPGVSKSADDPLHDASMNHGSDSPEHGGSECGDSELGDRVGRSIPYDDVQGFAQFIASLLPADSDAGRIDQIRLLENLKSQCAAAQARITVEFVASQRQQNARVPNPDQGRHGAGVQNMTGPGDAGCDREGPSARETADREGLTSRNALDHEGPTAREAADREAITAPSGGSAGQCRAQRRAKAERLATRSAAAQVALARRESPQRGGKFVGLAEALVHEMPATLTALQDGVLNEWRATIIVRETACLTSEQRTQVDTEISGRLDGLGDARVQALVKKIAYRLDAEAATRRAVRASSERRVSLRPAPDAMAYLTALLPLGPAVACLAALQQEADAHPGGDDRTRQQRMADIYVSRLTGEETGRSVSANDNAADDPTVHGTVPGSSTVSDRSLPTDPVAAVRAAYEQATKRDSPGDPSPSPRLTPGPSLYPSPIRYPGQKDSSTETELSDAGAATHAFPPGTNVVINLVISDRTLLAGGNDPALLPGNLPIPAPLARRMVADLPDATKVWLRRLYTRPDTGELVTADSRQRIFPAGMRNVLLMRDQTCRTPWCNAPGRHADHLLPYAEGGRTSLANGQILSEDCNYIRTAPGWAAARDPKRPGDIRITTPTGHRYRSPVPELLPRATPAITSAPESVLESVLESGLESGLTPAVTHALESVLTHARRAGPRIEIRHRPDLHIELELAAAS